MAWDRRISLIISIAYLVIAVSQDKKWPVLFGYCRLDAEGSLIVVFVF
jgi:hypothetical protein